MCNQVTQLEKLVRFIYFIILILIKNIFLLYIFLLLLLYIIYIGNRTAGPPQQSHQHQPPNNDPKFHHVAKDPVTLTQSSATIEAPGGPCKNYIIISI
jgi:hypothetical protein